MLSNAWNVYEPTVIHIQYIRKGMTKNKIWFGGCVVRVPTTLALFSNYNIAFSCVQSLVQCLSLYIIHTFYRFCINIVCAHDAFDEPITHTNHYIENSGLNRTKNKEELDWGKNARKSAIGPNRRTRRRSGLGLAKWTQFFDESLCLLRIHANTPKIYAAFSRNKQPPPPNSTYKHTHTPTHCKCTTRGTPKPPFESCTRKLRITLTQGHTFSIRARTVLVSHITCNCSRTRARCVLSSSVIWSFLWPPTTHRTPTVLPQTSGGGWESGRNGKMYTSRRLGNEPTRILLMRHNSQRQSRRNV